MMLFMRPLSRFSSSALILFLFLLVAVAMMPMPSQAHEVSDTNSYGAAVNSILKVLRHTPAEASESCLGALSRMHKAEKDLKRIEERENDSDTELVQDVLASDLEDVTLMCGADAHRLCRQKKKHDHRLNVLCDALPDQSSDTD